MANTNTYWTTPPTATMTNPQDGTAPQVSYNGYEGDLSQLATDIANNPISFDYSSFLGNLNTAISNYTSQYAPTISTAIPFNTAALANAQGSTTNLVPLQNYLSASPGEQSAQNAYNQQETAYNNLKTSYGNEYNQYAALKPEDVSKMIGMGEVYNTLSKLPNSVANTGSRFGDLTYNTLENAGDNGLSQWQLNHYTQEMQQPFTSAAANENQLMSNTQTLFKDMGLSGDEVTKYMQPLQSLQQQWQSGLTLKTTQPSPPQQNTPTDNSWQGGGS